ncbi:hypothetical protein TIFTF001_021437 [Ficus carica]|uniref:Uncharacterized protein n=1 Tax=Ficus carica TaxID=3494 RepID=A0AA88ACQ5_FICCA|nr:hypothetical protein TIFTF001_021437 [Ficus carica]
MESSKDTITEMENTKLRDCRRFHVADDEISSDFIAIPILWSQFEFDREIHLRQ